MKNKTITYILLFLVLVIWGTILYKIFFYTESESETFSMGKTSLTKITPESSDTFSLSLNYSDPFLKENVRSNSISKSSTSTRKSGQVKPTTIKNNPSTSPQVVWPKVKYEGLIKNNNNSTAILSINGSTQFLKIGDSFNDVKVESITKDSVIVSYHKNSKTIKK